MLVLQHKLLNDFSSVVARRSLISETPLHQIVLRLIQVVYLEAIGILICGFDVLCLIQNILGVGPCCLYFSFLSGGRLDLADHVGHISRHVEEVVGEAFFIVLVVRSDYLIHTYIKILCLLQSILVWWLLNHLGLEAVSLHIRHIK